MHGTTLNTHLMTCELDTNDSNVTSSTNDSQYDIPAVTILTEIHLKLSHRASEPTKSEILQASFHKLMRTSGNTVTVIRCLILNSTTEL